MYSLLGGLMDWSDDHFAGCLLSWLIGRLIDGLLVCCLVAWLLGGLVGWLLGCSRFVLCLLRCLVGIALVSRLYVCCFGSLLFDCLVVCLIG